MSVLKTMPEPRQLHALRRGLAGRRLVAVPWHSTMLSETAEQPPEWFETDPLRVALKVTVLAQVMKNDPKFGMRILGQEVGTKVLFKFLGGVVAVYAFLAPKLFERGDSE